MDLYPEWIKICKTEQKRKKKKQMGKEKKWAQDLNKYFTDEESHQGGVQTKTARRCHYTYIRMENIKTVKTPNAGKGEEKHDLSYAVGGGAEWKSHSGKTA